MTCQVNINISDMCACNYTQWCMKDEGGGLRGAGDPSIILGHYLAR